MWFNFSRKTRSTDRNRSRRPNFRPTLETLEGRRVPSTVTVTNNHDSGTGSLRAEIAAAHNGDTIVFAPSLDGQTITLTSGELLISHNVTIAGPGAGELTVSGNHASRVFEVTKTTKSVTLSGLTISSGTAPANVGGGGIVNDGTLAVSNCTLSGNTSTGGDGGGIENDYGATLTVSNSILSGNSAGQGGALFNYHGALTVNGSTLTGNSADIGGGIWNDSTLTVSGSTLSGNSAHSGGGISTGASYRGGPATISNSTLSGNISTSSGGGITNYGGTLTVSGSNLTGNVASQRGGGIFNNNGTLTVKNSTTITGNSAPLGFGADVYNQGVLYLDSISTIGILDGNSAIAV
jgi:hypothetical protein